MEYQVPNWKRVKLPLDIFEKGNKNIYETVLPENIALEKSFSGERLPFRKKLDDCFEQVINQEISHDFTLRVNRKSFGESAYMKFILEDHHYENIHVDAEAGSRATLVFDYDQESDGMINHHQWIQVDAAEGSDIHVVVIQRLGLTSRHFSQQVAHVKEGASVKWTNIQLGAKWQVVSMESNLLGRHANTQMNLGYFLDGQGQGDYGNTVIHDGKMTSSKILAKGVLKDQTRKVYRGNLFFEKGSSQSVGKEEEFCTLLNEGIRADSIPALLCEEDDVIGEHAASAGQIDDEKLFYIMSRGYSEKAAKKLLIIATFSDLLSILDPKLQERLIDWIVRRVEDEREIPHIHYKS